MQITGVRVRTDITSLGSGEYRFRLRFQDSGQAPYLRVGDIITVDNGGGAIWDPINLEPTGNTGDRYEVLRWDSQPGRFLSNTYVEVSYIDLDQAPAADSSYYSTAQSPNIPDYRPEVAWKLEIRTITEDTNTPYVYNIDEIRNIEFGDPGAGYAGVTDFYITDNNGYIYQITEWNGLTTGEGEWDGSSGIVVKEVDELGSAPIEGPVILHRTMREADLLGQGRIYDALDPDAADRSRSFNDIIHWDHRGVQTVDPVDGTHTNVTILEAGDGIALENTSDTGWPDGKTVTIKNKVTSIQHLTFYEGTNPPDFADADVFGFTDAASFDPTQDQDIIFWLNIRQDYTSGVIFYLTYALSTSESSKDVLLELAYVVKDEGENVETGGTAYFQDVTLHVGDAADTLYVDETSLAIPSGRITSSTREIELRLKRKGTYVEDTFNGFFALKSIHAKPV